MTPLNFFIASVIIFVALLVITFTRHEWNDLQRARKIRRVGLRKEAAALREKIKYACHKAELAFLEDDIIDFESRHRGQPECKGMCDMLTEEFENRENKISIMLRVTV